MSDFASIEYPRLETERLILRGWHNHDLDDYALIVADPEVARWTNPDGKPLDRGAAWRSMAMVTGHWSLRGYGFFAVQEKTSGRVIGRIGAWYPEGWPGVELGWALGPGARGKGYATEAGQACLQWMFAELNLPQIISLILPDNEKSIAVAERLGERFLRTGTVTGITCNIYGIDRRWPH